MSTKIKFESGEEYLTRDGRRARIYATDGEGEDAIHGAIFEAFESPGWVMCSWCADGSLFEGDENDEDLMPPLREWWIVAGEAWDNEREATDSCRLLRFSTKPIHVREVRDDQA